MKPTFKPEISLSVIEGKSVLIILAPKDIKDQIWEIIKLIDKDNIVERVGFGLPTKMATRPYEGYSMSTAIGVSLAAVYIAVFPGSLTDLWEIDVERHFSEALYKQFLDSSFETENPNSLVYEGFKYMFETYIYTQANGILQNARQKKIADKKISETTVSLWIFEVSSAFRRLKFSNMNHEYLTREAAYIHVFECALEQVQDINVRITDRNRTVAVLIDSFLKALEKDFVPSKAMYFEWLKDKISELGLEAEKINASFDKGPYVRLLNEIRLNTPPEVPASKN